MQRGFPCGCWEGRWCWGRVCWGSGQCCLWTLGAVGGAQGHPSLYWWSRGKGVARQLLRAEPVWPAYRRELQSPISSALAWGEMCLPRGLPALPLPALGHCPWHSAWGFRVVFSLDSFLISSQDNQELRTTKYPAPGLCEEPPPALHVSVLCSCPRPLRSCSEAVAKTPQSSRREGGC